MASRPDEPFMLYMRLDEGADRMLDAKKSALAREKAAQDIEEVRHHLGPFVVAADSTRMPMIFTNAKSDLCELVYANQSFLSLTGYQIGEVIGLPFHKLIATSDRGGAELENIAGKPRSTVDLCCIRKDQTEYAASVLVSPVCDKEGQVQQYFVCVGPLGTY